MHTFRKLHEQGVGFVDTHSSGKRSKANALSTEAAAWRGLLEGNMEANAYCKYTWSGHLEFCFLKEGFLCNECKHAMRETIYACECKHAMSETQRVQLQFC